MPAFGANTVLVQIGDAAGTTFTNMTGGRTKTIKFNTETVDVTNSDSPNRWRELLAGVSVKSLSVEFAGVFLDDPVDTTVDTVLLANEARRFRVIFPGFRRYEGLFIMSSRSLGGEHTGAVEQSITLESAGEITVTAL